MILSLLHSGYTIKYIALPNLLLVWCQVEKPDTTGRIWLANIPPYSPELNPDEFVWAHLKKVQIPNTIAKNVKELKDIAQKGMEKIQSSVELVKSFFNGANYHNY